MAVVNIIAGESLTVDIVINNIDDIESVLLSVGRCTYTPVFDGSKYVVSLESKDTAGLCGTVPVSVSMEGSTAGNSLGKIKFDKAGELVVTRSNARDSNDATSDISSLTIIIDYAEEALTVESCAYEVYKGADGADSFVYVAYALDSDGAGFSLTPTDALKYRAEIHTIIELAPPTETDFAVATWVKYVGDMGLAGEGGEVISSPEVVESVLTIDTESYADSKINSAITIDEAVTVAFINADNLSTVSIPVLIENVGTASLTFTNEFVSGNFNWLAKTWTPTSVGLFIVVITTVAANKVVAFSINPAT